MNNHNGNIHIKKVIYSISQINIQVLYRYYSFKLN